MSSRKGNGSSSSTITSGSSSKGKNKSDVSSPDINQLTNGASDVKLNSAPDDVWKVYRKKSKNSQHNSSKAWAHPNTVQKLGMRRHDGSGTGSGQTWSTLSSDSKKPAGTGYAKPEAAPLIVPPPLKNAQRGSLAIDETSKADTDDSDSDGIDDSDDELDSDGFDSDESQKSHETRKRNKWFKEFFGSLGGPTIAQINETERQWHCPVCKGGPRAIDWYRGLQPLITHARTTRSKRVKLHRELAELLDEELRIRGTSAMPTGEVFRKWKGLEESADKEIVWPPAVMIMNTKLEKDDNEKWIGMGNQELLDYFGSYSAVKARHSYGPQGHRGISVLIFEASAVGYVEAERLSKHFEDNGRDRLAWGRNMVPFYPGGTRKLYGFMAGKKDMDNFNQHSLGKSKLKFEMRSYQEMVVNQMKQMGEDNQQLLWFKNKAAKEHKSKKALEESYCVMAEKLRKVSEENKIMKNRTKKHHEQNKEQMDYQEKFFREEIQQLYNERNVKEDNFEKVQQSQRDKITQIESSIEQHVQSREEISQLIQLQDKEMEEYAKERDELVKAHQQRMMELKRVHLEQEMALERDFDADFNLLLEKYTPK